MDLMRWAAGKLLEMEPKGLYFSGLGKHDITGDGIEDIVLLDLSQYRPVPQTHTTVNPNLTQILGWE